MTLELALFPLNVVLFPGMLLPLHIFEPRYRLMMRRCLDADSTFGVALIASGEEGSGGTVAVGCGCAAEILEAMPFHDGRINLKTVGRRRFRVVTTREEDEYLVGTVEWLDDSLTSSRAEEQAARVQRRLRSYLETATESARLQDLSVEDIRIPDDPYELSMWMAALMPLPNQQKQQLLEMTSTEERLSTELSFLQRAEIIQKAFEKRAPQPGDEECRGDDMDNLSGFISPN